MQLVVVEVVVVVVVVAGLCALDQFSKAARAKP